jgi:hypothetical protein
MSILFLVLGSLLADFLSSLVFAAFLKLPEPASKLAERSPVPDEADLTAAEKEIKEIHKDGYTKRKPAEIVALAGRLLREGLETKDKPAFRYVLLREARDLAARVGEVPRSLQAAQEMGNSFDVVAEEMKAAALEVASRAATTAATRLSVATAALAVTDDAFEADQYAAAERLAKIAQTISATWGAHPVVAAAQARTKEAAALRQAYEDIRDSLAKLEATPDDAEANLAVGGFYALARGDWDRGVGFLARGSDAKLKAVTEKDVAGPADGDAAAELAERYTAHAASETGAAKTHLLFRALYWYERARSRLAGLDRTKVEKKLATLEKTLPQPRVVVLHASYGAYNGWADVTDKVRGLAVQAKGAKLAVKVALEVFGIPDPCFGEHKTLVVVYRHGGGTRLSVTGDAETATIPMVPGPPDKGPAKPAAGQQLLILAALYGNQGTFADVTEKVQTAVKGHAALADPGALDLGDPFPGRHKALVIAYREAGKVRLSLTQQEVAARLGTPQ